MVLQNLQHRWHNLQFNSDVIDHKNCKRSNGWKHLRCSPGLGNHMARVLGERAQVVTSVAAHQNIPL